MKKGQKKRIWTPEQKSEIVHKHIDDHISLGSLAKEYSADKSMLCRWVKEFTSGGENSFQPKKHPGNHYAALYTSNTLSELEMLRLTVAKLEIENERLKKGYLVEGVGADRVYVTGNVKIMK